MKVSSLVICLILGVFRNTLTAKEKYPVRDSENLSSTIQMQLSLNILKKTKDHHYSYFISEITDCQRLG